MKRSWSDLTICAALLAATALATLAGLPELLRAPLGLLAVLGVTGYAILAAAFGRHRLPPLMLAVLTPAVSVAVCALVAVLIDATGIRLGRTSYTLVLTLVDALALLACARRRPFERPPAPVALPRPRVSTVLAAAVAAIIAVTGIAVAREPRSVKDIEGHSTLWAVRAGGGVDVGVRSDELGATAYRLDVVSGGRPARRERIELAPGATWEAHVGVQPDRVAVVQLFREPDTRLLYRRVELAAGR